MADWAIYWRDYRVESGASGEPVVSWLTSREWLVDGVNHGDRIWLFIGGDACGDDEHPHRAYVAQLLVVDDVFHNPDHDPRERDSPLYQIDGIKNRCVLSDPPALVDDILRKAGSNAEQHIGESRQTPFRLDGGEATRLLDLMKRRYHQVYLAAVPESRTAK